MSDTRGFSFLSRTLGLFEPKPKKITKSSARRGDAKALNRKNSRRARNGQIGGNPYQAAEIECDAKCACDAVKRVAGRRLLVRDVPAIPLPDCDVTDCKCTYVRYKDRRLWSAERRSYYNRQTELYRKGDGEDRRNTQDRRVSEESRAGRKRDESLDDFESWFK